MVRLWGCILLVLIMGAPVFGAQEENFLFFGIVTVRDGKTIFLQNPALTEEQAAHCLEATGDYLELDREFTTTTNDDGIITYTWGTSEGELTEEGLVPYTALFVTGNEMIDIEEANVEPYDAYMGFGSSSTTGLAQLDWWAPETEESCHISLDYYDNTSYRIVTVLEFNQIVSGKSGTSPDGITWKIESISHDDESITLTVKTTKGPDGHAFAFWMATNDWPEPQSTSAWAEEDEAGETLTYEPTQWLSEDDKLIHFDIRERHPDRIKHWGIDQFSLKAE